MNSKLDLKYEHNVKKFKYKYDDMRRFFWKVKVDTNNMSDHVCMKIPCTRHANEYNFIF